MANLKNKWLIGTVSAATIAGAVLWEGKTNSPIIPIPSDVPTVCYGETHVAMKNYSDADCMTMLKAHLPTYGDGVLHCINVPISQSEHSAFTLFAWNEGVYLFCHSSILAKLNAGDHKAACKQMATNDNGTPAFSFSGGRYVQGLQNRRQYEAKLCAKELT